MDIKKIEKKDRLLDLQNYIDDDTVAVVNKKILEINIDDEEYTKNVKNMLDIDFEVPHINIMLSTYGGSVYDGLSLYDVIKHSKTPVDVTCMGKIMSMGIIIMLASSNRRAYKNTTFMIHQVSSGCFGRLEDMEEDIEETKRVNNLIFDIIAKNTKITKNKLNEIKKLKKDWYITAEEALELGLITEIIE